jgi:hypothetical protein
MNVTRTDTGYYWEGSDGDRNFFNEQLYLQILSAKQIDCGHIRESNIPVDIELTNQLKDKQIIGFPFDDNTIYVQSVHKGWLLGYYLVILYYSVLPNNNRSHGQFTYKNINSIHPIILQQMAHNAHIQFE